MNTKKQAYSQKLLDPRWQKKRLEILQRDNFTCQCCLDNESTLHVHHKVYEYGKEPWDYPTDKLITLCADCHKMEGYYKTELQEMITQLLVDGYTYEHLCQYLSGLQRPLPDYSFEERVRLGSFSTTTPQMLDTAKDNIENDWQNFFTEIGSKDWSE